MLYSQKRVAVTTLLILTLLWFFVIYNFWEAPYYGTCVGTDEIYPARFITQKRDGTMLPVFGALLKECSFLGLNVTGREMVDYSKAVLPYQSPQSSAAKSGETIQVQLEDLTLYLVDISSTDVPRYIPTVYDREGLSFAVQVFIGLMLFTGPLVFAVLLFFPLITRREVHQNVD